MTPGNVLEASPVQLKTTWVDELAYAAKMLGSLQRTKRTPY